MRSKKVLGIMITAWMSFMAVFPANAAMNGKLSGVSDTKIKGWCYDDSESQSQALPVEITVSDYNTGTEVFSQTVSANETDAQNSSGDDLKDYHNFSLDIDWTTIPSGKYIVKAECRGIKLPGSKTYTNNNGKETEETEEKEEQAEENISSGRSLGVFKTTAYCPCRSCSGNWGRRTSTGATARAKHTIAVDPRVIPYGTKLMIDGVVYTAEDEGGRVRGNHIDIFFDSHSEAKAYGLRYVEVFLAPAN